MFRKPMRLEKWIAYDGALIAEVVDAVNDAGGDAEAVENKRQTDRPDDGHDDVSPLFMPADAPFETDDDGSASFWFDLDKNGSADGGIAISAPADPTGDSDYYFPFADSDIAYNLGGSDAGDIWLEISDENGGSLVFWNYTDNPSSLITSNGLQTGQVIVLNRADADGNLEMVSYIVDAENRTLTEKCAIGYRKTVDGTLRFAINDGVAASDVADLIRSIVYSNRADAAPSLKIGFYMGGDDPATWVKSPAGDDPVFDADDGGNDISISEPGPDPDPDPDPDPGDDDDILPPVNPPGGEGDDDGGEGDDDGGEGDSGGDDPGDGGEGDGGQAGYIFQREDDLFDGEAGEATYIPDEDADDAASAESDGDDVESAAAAAMLELSLDLENYIEIVQGDKAALARALMLLETEYLLRGSSEWRDLRDPLREIFSTGGREMDAVNRVIAQLKSQLEAFRRMPMERRDGMMLESLRELLDSAARRSAETNAMAAAVARVAEALRKARDADAEPPDADELAAIFQREYDLAMASWRERAGLSDAMGKDLANFRLMRRKG